MKLARWVFLLAGIYGFVTVAPLYFLEEAIARASAPITHPEYFYGFVGVTLVWQILFLAISRDPARWRPAMPIALLEKLSFGLPMLAFYARGRIAGGTMVFAGIDLVWAVLFVIAFVKTPTVPRPR